MAATEYRSISGPSEGLYKEKGSKFLAYAYPVNSDSDIKMRMAEVKELHPRARHHCSGYRLGIDEINEFAGDAGEPSGSAGLPILNQLRSADITNCLIVVVRYFGGTKLGIPGLIHAYKEASVHALSANSIVTLEVMVSFKLEAPYSGIDKIYKEVQRNEGRIDHQDIGNTGLFRVSIPARNAEHFTNVMQSYILLLDED